MNNPDIFQALLYVFIAAGLGALLVWLILRLQLKDWQTRFSDQSEQLNNQQEKLEKAESELVNIQSAFQQQANQISSFDEARSQWKAAEKIRAAEKRALAEWKAKAEKLEAELRKRSSGAAAASKEKSTGGKEQWKSRLEKVEKARLELENELTEAARREARWHKEILTMQAEILRLQAKNSVHVPTEPTADLVQEDVLKPKERDKEAITLARIKERAKELNFDRIGYARETEKDDLKRIKGIGPFLEKKLNSIGIYALFQLANFESEDEDMVNEAIEFFPGRIKRDEWVSQAKELLKQNDSK